MNEPSQVSIPELLTISQQLVGTYFTSTDIYSLLVLSLLTVTKYSRERKHLTSANRADLAIAYAPDLICNLKIKQYITEEEANNLLKELKDREDELPIIIKSYIYIGNGLQFKMGRSLSGSLTPPLTPPKHRRCDMM